MSSSRVRVFETTEAAIADLSLVYATTARRRDLQKPVFGPEEAAQRVICPYRRGQRAGLLFGRERWGLYNEEVALSDAIVTLPVEAAFASLNIAQAVLIIAYEWRRQSDHGKQLLFDDMLAEAATKDELVRPVRAILRRRWTGRGSSPPRTSARRWSTTCAPC